MPESVDNRPTRSHEFIFLLTKRASGFFYDHESIKEPVGESMLAAAKRKVTNPGQKYKHDEHNRGGKTSPNRMWSDPATVARILKGRNKRDVWTVSTINYRGTQDATFPPALVEPMILAGTSAGGCCAACGAPFERAEEAWAATCQHGAHVDEEVPISVSSTEEEPLLLFDESAEDDVGEQPTTHVVRRYVLPPSEIPVVLDPFGGSGTVSMVAQQHNRRAILIDLNDEYIEQQMKRNADVPFGI